MAKTIAVVTQKGGVGKTTTVLNLGHALARKGQKVLLVDLDPQAHLTRTIGVETPGIMDALAEGEKLGPTVDTRMDGVRFLPAASDMVAADMLLANVSGRETRLLHGLDTPAIKGVDVILIDTPPSLGLLTVNALFAADFVCVPLPPDFLPLSALPLLAVTLQRARAVMGARFEILGFLLTMYDRRERVMREEVEAALKKQYGRLVLPCVIRQNANIRAAFAQGQSVLDYERSGGRGTEDFLKLAEVLTKRMRRA